MVLIALRFDDKLGDKYYIVLIQVLHFVIELGTSKSLLFILIRIDVQECLNLI